MLLFVIASLKYQGAKLYDLATRGHKESGSSESIQSKLVGLNQ